MGLWNTILHSELLYVTMKESDHSGLPIRCEIYYAITMTMQLPGIIIFSLSAILSQLGAVLSH